MEALAEACDSLNLVSPTGGLNVLSGQADLAAHIARVGLNYKLGGGAQVATKY